MMYLLTVFTFASPYYTSQTPVHVNGYLKQDGTYVQPYWRAKPHKRADSNSHRYSKNDFPYASSTQFHIAY